MSGTLERSLKWIAVLTALLVGGAVIFDKISNRDPNAALYQAALDAFEEGNWAKAHTQFARVADLDPANLAARRGAANSLVQLARYDEAYQVMTDVIAAEPQNACNYATRGIIEDHRERHRKAMADYAKAVADCPAARDGMSWLQRVLANVHEQPPTIADRLQYLRHQMTLPADQRMLRLPARDRAQKPWKG